MRNLIDYRLNDLYQLYYKVRSYNILAANRGLEGAGIGPSLAIIVSMPMEDTVMVNVSSEFSLNVDGVKGLCPPGEDWAKRHMEQGNTPVISCEGPCVRGDIARLVANIIAEQTPYARCCFQEAFSVPHSAMAKWLKEESDKIVMIDGCFLTCVGRILNKQVERDKIVHFDILPMYDKYKDSFAMDDVPVSERQAIAGKVADKLLLMLKENM